MRILSAQFKNWCQHAERDISFSDGLNAIRGPNGSGKSNILTGIVFGLTGEFGRNPGVKTDNIYQLAAKDAKAGVKLEIIQGSTKFTVERNLRPNNQKLIIDGDDKPITKADEINKTIQEILGVNERLLLDYVFVDQWKIFSFIDQSPTIRAKAFGQLFNAEKADSIWRTMGEFKIAVPVPAIAGDQVRIRIANNQTELRLVQTELAKYNHLPEKWNYNEDPLLDIIEQNSRKEALYAEILTSVADVNNISSSIKTLVAELEPLEEQITDYQTALENSRKEAEQARADLASWQAFEQVDKARAMLENEVQQLTKEIEANNPPAKPENYCGPLYHEHQENLDGWRVQMSSLTRLLTTFDINSKLSACPTCGTPVVTLLEKINAARIELSQLRESSSTLSQLIAESKKYDAANINYVAWREAKRTSLSTAEVRLLNLGESRKPTKNKEELRGIVDEYELVRSYNNDSTATLAAKKNELAKLEGKKASIDSHLLNLHTEYDSLTITPEQVAAARLQLEEKQNQFGIRSNLRYQLNTLARLLRDDELALQKFQLDERKASKLRRLTSHLDNVRGVFKDLPQVASQACLDSMVDDTNDILDLFEAPFRVVNANDLSFTLRKHNGIITPAERLSGGEKGVFSMAFRIVINSRFAGSLGLLCLDEPTAGLDEDNEACLEIALGRLRELSASRGLQVILITHDTGLDGLFDRVIKLTSAR